MSSSLTICLAYARSGCVFEFNLAKAQANLRKHGVCFAHDKQALREPLAVTIEDPDAIGERRLISLSMDALGRVLVVVHTKRE